VLNLIQASIEEAKVAHCISAKQTHGSLPAAMDLFRSSDSIRVLLMTLNKGSRGANLTQASHVIFAEPSLSIASEQQAIGRMDRFGQTKAMHVHRFVLENTIEQPVLELAMKRRNEAFSRDSMRSPKPAKAAKVDAKLSNSMLNTAERSMMDLDTLEALLQGGSAGLGPSLPPMGVDEGMDIS